MRNAYADQSTDDKFFRLYPIQFPVGVGEKQQYQCISKPSADLA